MRGGAVHEHPGCWESNGGLLNNRGCARTGLNALTYGFHVTKSLSRFTPKIVPLNDVSFSPVVRVVVVLDSGGSETIADVF